MERAGPTSGQVGGPRRGDAVEARRPLQRRRGPTGRPLPVVGGDDGGGHEPARGQRRLAARAPPWSPRADVVGVGTRSPGRFRGRGRRRRSPGGGVAAGGGAVAGGRLGRRRRRRPAPGATVANVVAPAPSPSARQRRRHRRSPTDRSAAGPPASGAVPAASADTRAVAVVGTADARQHEQPRRRAARTAAEAATSTKAARQVDGHGRDRRRNIDRPAGVMLRPPRGSPQGHRQVLDPMEEVGPQPVHRTGHRQRRVPLRPGPPAPPAARAGRGWRPGEVGSAAAEGDVVVGRCGPRRSRRATRTPRRSRLAETYQERDEVAGGDGLPADRPCRPPRCAGSRGPAARTAAPPRPPWG